MTFAADFFFSFRSPYSYIGLVKLRDRLKDHDVAIRLRPVYPMAVRLPGFFKRSNPLMVKYVALDTARVAQQADIPFHFPRPDPIVQDMESLDVSPEQPYIHRLTRLAAAAQLEGRSLEFANAIAPVLWDGSVIGWDEGDHLSRAAASAGFDLEALDAAIVAAPERYETVIKDNENDLGAAGHWGVPTFVFRGEPFFGQDRLDALFWRMKSYNLQHMPTE